VQPTFAVVQGASSRSVLEEMVGFFGCGHLSVNRRHDDHREDLYCYKVSRFGDLRDVIVPFFQANALRTAKREDFAKFVEVINLMHLRRHLTVPGLIEIAEIVQTMNFRKSSEVLRILRDHTPTFFPPSGKKMRWPVPYGDVGRLTETFSPPFRNHTPPEWSTSNR
jgi:hypothetical protein